MSNNGIINLKNKCADKYLRENPDTKISLPAPSRNPIYAKLDTTVTPAIVVDESKCPNSTAAPVLNPLY